MLHITIQTAQYHKGDTSYGVEMWSFKMTAFSPGLHKISNRTNMQWYVWQELGMNNSKVFLSNDKYVCMIMLGIWLENRVHHVFNFNKFREDASFWMPTMRAQCLFYIVPCTLICFVLYKQTSNTYVYMFKGQDSGPKIGSSESGEMSVLTQPIIISAGRMVLQHFHICSVHAVSPLRVWLIPNA